jgi:hypothetical protein
VVALETSADARFNRAARRMIGRSIQYQLAAPKAIATGSTASPSTIPDGRMPSPRAKTISGMCHR